MLYDPLLNWTTQHQITPLPRNNNELQKQHKLVLPQGWGCRGTPPGPDGAAGCGSGRSVTVFPGKSSDDPCWRLSWWSGGAAAAAESARRASRLGLSWVAAHLDEGGSSYRAKMSRGWAAAKAEWGPTLWATPPRFHRCDSHSGFYTAALSPTFSVCRCHTHGHTDTHTVTHTQTHNINSSIFVLPLRLIYHWHVFDFNIIYVCMCAAVLFVLVQSVKNVPNGKDSLWPCLFYLSVPTAYTVCILKKYYSATLLNTHVIKDCWFCIAFTV